MTLHIFNPDHDLALAAHIANFTAPHAGRQLRADLGYLPALWARNGDVILVDDKDTAINGYRKLKLNHRPDIVFLEYTDLRELFSQPVKPKIEPWGWNLALRDKLKRAGVGESSLPSTEQLEVIRNLSNRSHAVKLLDELKQWLVTECPEYRDGLTGESCICHSYEELMAFLSKHTEIVVKAPWSSSGRGVRYITKESLDDNVVKWIQNTLAKQQTIVAEVKCHKVHDFAMEYIAQADGSVTACGLSLFTTVRGAYTGNRLDTEEEKRKWLDGYIDSRLFEQVIQETERQLSLMIGGRYVGPLGVDMMIVSNGIDGERFLLNPCIEINLRRTMGHVALALSDAGHRGTMRIEPSYKLKIEN